MGMGRFALRGRWPAALLTASSLAVLPPPLDDLLEPLLDPVVQSQPGARGLAFRSTGDHAERVRTVPIKRRAARSRRVALSTPLPALRRGDRLRIGAEVLTSTTCVEPGSHCVGRRYSFDPAVSARLAIAGDPDEARARRTLAVGRKRSIRCSQSRPDRNHHCVLVLRRNLALTDQRLPCDPRACHLNLIVGATHSKARRGQVVVVGGDRPNGAIEQDKGRLAAIVLRDRAPVARRTRVDRDPEARVLALSPQTELGRRVIYSRRVYLRKGDVLAAESIHRVATPSASNAFIGARLVLASSPQARRPDRPARRSALLRGQITETNGVNCTTGPSAFRSPCRLAKTGALRIRRTPRNADGHRVPLYVNLVVRALPVLPQLDADGWVRVLRGGHLRLTRYRPG